FVMMGACVVVSPFVLLPSEMKLFAKSLIAVPSFSSNFLFWRESGYFDIAGHLKPLLHTWSLAVEEQFYLVYPFFLLAIWKLAKPRVALLLALTALISLGLAHWAAFHRPGAAFYLLPTRGWELLMGGLAAYHLLIKKEELLTAPIAEVLGLVGLVFTILPIFLFSAATPHPSLYTLVPTVGTTLVILFARADNYAGRILINPIFVGLGLISYSAYLWHQPIFAFARISSLNEPSSWLMTLLCALVLVVAYLSWRFVERPFRERSLVGRKWLGSGAVVGSALFVGIGIAGYGSSGFEYAYLLMLNDRQTKVWTESQDKPNDNGCKFPASEINADIEKRFNQCAVEYGNAIVVLGDSHGIDMYQAISFNSAYPFIVGLVQGGCRPHSPDPDCHLDDFRAFIERHGPRISQVFYNQAGFPLLTKLTAILDDRSVGEENASSYAVDDRKIELTIEFLEKLAGQVSVVWLGPSIEPDHNVKLVRKMAMSCQLADVAINRALDAALSRFDRDIKGIMKGKAPGVSYFSVIDALNFRKQVDIYDCDAIYWINGDHWSVAGEKRFGGRVVKALRDLNLVE
ncbi:MAG: hypothetical protein JWQ07_6022, partial [Ramlibacter sp.]|nr:hypothetical protein [Ramlibacter sp.]